MTEDQTKAIATLEKRAAPLQAFLEQLSKLETPATSSGRVYSPHLMQGARDDLRRAVLSARLAIEQPEV